MVARGSHTAGPHRSRAVWLLLWPGSRPWPRDAGAQFRVTDEAGTYLCVARALVFEGSILANNPAKNEAEWVPAHGLTNDLTWAKERSAIALANYVPCIPDEAARIARLGACQLVSWPDDSSTSEEEENTWDSKPPTTDTEEWGEESEDGARQTDLEEGVEPNRQQHLQDWEAVMEGSQGLACDDPQSDSDATVTGVNCPRGPASSPHTRSPATPRMPGSPMDQLLPMEVAIAVEVHVTESELDDL